MKVHLTNKMVRGLRPDKGPEGLKPRSVPYDVMDDVVRGYGVRILLTGEIIHILYRRFPGSRRPTRRKIGRFGNPTQRSFQHEMSVDDARDVAGAWIVKVKKGIDPSRELAREAQANIEAERRRSANSFRLALEAYYRHKSDEGLRSIDARKVAMNRELAPWLSLSLQDITEDVIRALVDGIKKRGHPAQALATLRLVKSFFSWICAHGGFGLKAKDNPCLGIGTKALAGTTKVRERRLSNEELIAFLRACDVVGYPNGSYFKLLLMASLRRTEVAKARWEEFDLYGAKLWTVPGTRMKKTRPTDTDRDHIVPLTPDLIEFLETLPRFDGFVFSNCGGKKAVADYVGMKDKIDDAMRAELGIKFKPWAIHDLRRTARTKYSELKIPKHIGWLLLAHTKVDAYDKFDYLEEKRDGLLKWHDYLKDLVKNNVVPMPSLAA